MRGEASATFFSNLNLINLMLDRHKVIIHWCYSKSGTNLRLTADHFLGRAVNKLSYSFLLVIDKSEKVSPYG